MANTISFTALSNDGEDAVGEFGEGEISIGREPENAVVIESDAVSRQHAVVFNAGSHWILNDLGSSNGTWVNGVALQEGHYRLLHDGDVLQFANAAVRVNVPFSASLNAKRCMCLVFDREAFVGEFELPMDGDRFVMGGPESTLSLSGLDEDLPFFVAARTNGRIELTVHGSQREVLVNGMHVQGVVSLNDRDEISVGRFKVLLLDMSAVRVGETTSPRNGVISPEGFAASAPNTSLALSPSGRGWEAQANRRRGHTGRRFVFGTPLDDEDVEGTTAMSREEFDSKLGGEMNASRRFSAPTDEGRSEASGSHLGEIVLITVGALVFLTMIGVSLYLFLS